MLTYSITDWIDKNMVKLGNEIFVTEHLYDEDFKYHREINTIEKVIKLYCQAIKFINSQNLKLRFVLVISLEVLDNRIHMSYPKNIEDLIFMMNEMEPPSIYLTKEDFDLFDQKGEEYHISLPNDFFGLDLMGANILYREFRDEALLKNDWEFSRFLHIYPTR